MEITISDIVGIIGLCGLVLAYIQFRKSQKLTQIIEINNWFMNDFEESDFFYRLDYTDRPSSFIFDPTKFPTSDDEKTLDRLLTKISRVGYFLKGRLIEKRDIIWIMTIVKVTLQNSEVQSYLEWIKREDQLPEHIDFRDAIYLYGELFGKNDMHYTNLAKYID